MSCTCSKHVVDENAYKVKLEKSEGKRSLGGTQAQIIHHQ
jgi:hypothetical protein